MQQASSIGVYCTVDDRVINLQREKKRLNVKIKFKRKTFNFKNLCFIQGAAKGSLQTFRVGR